MANSYYARQNSYTTGAIAKGTDVVADLDAVVTGFDTVEASMDNAIKLTNADVTTDQVISSNAATRASKVIGFDSAGDLVLASQVTAITAAELAAVVDIGAITQAAGTFLRSDGTDWLGVTSLNLVAGNNYQINATSVLNATTLGAAVVASSLTSVGALNAGSITSGFGAIDNGASNITTTGTIAGSVGTFSTNVAVNSIDMVAGINWTIRTSAADNSWLSVTYGNGLFVAVASTGSSNRVMTSPDGINWTIRTSAADNDWRYVTYGNGLFVAVATTGAGNRVMTSPDGINWTIRTSAADNSWNGVTYGNGLFVAVATTGTGNRVMTSPDGINWTIRTSAADNDWNGVTYGNGLFVAISATGTGNRAMTSPDGINWTIRTSAADNSWISVIYGNGLFVAVSFSGIGNRVMTSPDGINWTIRTSAADNDWLSVIYGNGLFVAVAQSGTGNRVMTSPDAITWTIRTSAADNSWLSVSYGNGLFVAISATGTGNRAMTSGKQEHNLIAHTNKYHGDTQFTGDVGVGIAPTGNPLAVNRSADGVIADFASAGAVEGTVSISGTTTSYNAFVGSHYTQLKDGQVEPPLGAVVVATGEIIPCAIDIYDHKQVENITAIAVEDAYEFALVDDIEISKLKSNLRVDNLTNKVYQTTTIPELRDVSGIEKKEYFSYVDTTTKPADKRVYGTWMGKMADSAEGMSFGESAKPVYLVSQVGLFKIRVTDTNGNIENGDYLQTSSRAMEAEKQTSGARLNSTIGKAMIDVDWTNVGVDPVLKYKWQLIPCTF